MSDQVQHRIQGGLTGLNTSVGHRGGGRRPPVSVAKITLKEHVYMPTSELVSM